MPVHSTSLILVVLSLATYIGTNDTNEEESTEKKEEKIFSDSLHTDLKGFEQGQEENKGKLKKTFFLVVVLPLIILTLVILLSGVLVLFIKKFPSVFTGFSYIVNNTIVNNLSLKEVIIPVITLSGVISASIFNYLIYKMHQQNQKVNKDLYNRGKQEKVFENALIVYCDLILGLNNLKKLYIEGIKPTGKIYLSNDWIKNVSALLGNGLTIDDINYIYRLYGELWDVVDMINNGINSNARIKITAIVNKNFNSTPTTENTIETEGDIERELTVNTAKVLLTLKKMTK